MGHNNTQNPELHRLVQSGVNGLEPHHQDSASPGKHASPGAPAELNGGKNGSAPAGSPAPVSSPDEPTAAPCSAKILDFSLLKSPFFCIYTWSLVFSQLAYFIPYFHLSARARTLGIDAMDASFIISLAGKAPHTGASVHCIRTHNRQTGSVTNVD